MASSLGGEVNISSPSDDDFVAGVSTEMLPCPDVKLYQTYYDYFADIVKYSERAWRRSGKSQLIQASPAVQGEKPWSDMDNFPLGESPTFYFYLTKELRQEDFLDTQYKYIQSIDMLRQHGNDGGRWHNIVEQVLDSIDGSREVGHVVKQDVLELEKKQLSDTFKHVYKLGMVYLQSLKQRHQQYMNRSPTAFSGSRRTFGAWWKVTLHGQKFDKPADKSLFVQGVEQQIHDYLHSNGCLMVKTKGGDRNLTEEYVFGKNFPDVVNLVNIFFDGACTLRPFTVTHKDYTKTVAVPRSNDKPADLFGDRGGSFQGRGGLFSVHDKSVSKDNPNSKPGDKRESTVPKEENPTKREKGLVKLLEFSKLKF